MRPRRFLLVGLAVAAGELLLATMLPGTVLGPYFATCAGLTAALAGGGARLLAASPPPGPPPRGSDPHRDPEPPPWRPDLGDVGAGGAPLEDAHEDVPVGARG